MTHERPETGCHELALRRGRALTEAAEVALEDYAQAVARARAAQAIHDLDQPGLVTGVHLCGLAAAPSEEVRRELDGFAGDLAGERESGGLGWS